MQAKPITPSRRISTFSSTEMQFHRTAAPSRAVAIPPLACPSGPRARRSSGVSDRLNGSNTTADLERRRRRGGPSSPISVVVASAASRSETPPSPSSPPSPPSSAITAADRAHMRRALELARKGLGSTEPNPAVGCVIVAAAGGEEEGEEGKGTEGDAAAAAAAATAVVVVGEGFHPRAGRPHAEVYALRAAGQRARGGTAYVTLEPCAHHGRTPPCARALIDAGVKRVSFFPFFFSRPRPPPPSTSKKKGLRLKYRFFSLSLPPSFKKSIPHPPLLSLRSSSGSWTPTRWSMAAA